jgi:hypothetical protein
VGRRIGQAGLIGFDQTGHYPDTVRELHLRQP